MAVLSVQLDITKTNGKAQARQKACALRFQMCIRDRILAEPVLRLLNTDPAVLDEALLYLRISYGGFAVVMAYNLLASVLRLSLIHI